MKVILRNKTCECHKLALATDIKSRGLSVEGTRVTLTSGSACTNTSLLHRFMEKKCFEGFQYVLKTVRSNVPHASSTDRPEADPVSCFSA